MFLTRGPRSSFSSARPLELSAWGSGVGEGSSWWLSLMSSFKWIFRFSWLSKSELILSPIKKLKVTLNECQLSAVKLKNWKTLEFIFLGGGEGTFWSPTIEIIRWEILPFHGKKVSVYHKHVHRSSVLEFRNSLLTGCRLTKVISHKKGTYMRYIENIISPPGLELRNISSSVEKYFKHEKRNFVSPSDHVMF